MFFCWASFPLLFLVFCLPFLSRCPGLFSVYVCFVAFLVPWSRRVVVRLCGQLRGCSWKHPTGSLRRGSLPALAMAVWTTLNPVGWRLPAATPPMALSAKSSVLFFLFRPETMRCRNQRSSAHDAEKQFLLFLIDAYYLTGISLAAFVVEVVLIGEAFSLFLSRLFWGCFSCALLRVRRIKFRSFLRG